MRNIINISLPASMAQAVKEEVKAGHYASTSEFFRKLLRDWMEEKLYQDVMESKKDLAEGRYKTLHSLKDLM